MNNNITITLIKSNEPDNDPRLIKEIESIKKFGYKINMLCWNRSNKNSNNRFEINDNCNVKEFNFRVRDGPASIIFWPVWWLYILFWLLRMNYDMIHVLNYNSVLPALIAAKLKKKPIIYEIMDTSYDALMISHILKQIIIYFDKLFMRFSDAIILVDENQIKQFGGIPNSNTSIIYDSAPDIFDEYSPKNRKMIDNDFVILYVGVLYKIRHLNLDKLCQVVQSLKGVRLLIAGYGDLVEDIKRWVSQSKGTVDFIGRVSYSEALKISFEADALVVLRDSDIRTNKYICGSKLWEAMMCGKPILVNKGTSTANKVRKENCGLVVDANNIEEIKEAIIRLKEDRELCKELGANGRKAYEERYSWEIMERRLLKLYEKILTSHKKGDKMSQISEIRATNKKRKILLISLTVPPIMGSHGRRVIHFLKYLHEFGWELDVLTVSPSSNFPLFDISSVKNLPSSVKIFRVYQGFLRKIYYKNVCYNNSAISSRRNFNNRKNKIFKEMFIKILEKSKIIIFEMNTCRLFDWSPFAIIKGVKLITRYNYDVLISSGLSDPHLIAYTIKKMKRKIPWIIDYGDPWVFASTYRDEHTKVKFVIDHWLEKRILKSASIITVTTEETKKNYLENYLFLEKEKIKVIPMGTDYDVFKKIRAEHSEKFRILYTGSIYPTRDIKPFLNAVKLLSEDKEMKENIEVLFVGNIEDKYKELVICMGLEDVITFGGFVPYEKSLSLMMGASVLLSFGNKGGLQVPGKLFDYVGSKRPILWIKGDERDPALRYLEGLNRAIIVNNKSEEIYSKILTLYNLYKKQEFEKTFNLEEVPAFSWKDRVKILNEICEELVDANK